MRAWHHTYGLPVLVTHCTNNYGPHQYREKLLPYLLAGGRAGESYHIAAGNPRPNLEVVRAVCQLLDELRLRADGGSYLQQVAHVPDRPGHDRRYALDASKVRTELGWQPEVSLEEGLRETVRWFVGRG